MSGRAMLCVLVAAVCYFAHLARASACSCVESAGVREDLATSGSVFEGKVTRLSHEPKHHRLTARIQVLRRWKGAEGKVVDVVTIDEGSLCGFGFERGKSYLLFTPEAEGTLTVSLCSRSQVSELAAANFTELDRLVAAEGGATSPPASPSATATPATSTAPPLPETPPVTQPSVPSSEPPTAAPVPRQGGCAGCSPTSTTATPGYLALAIALTLGWAARRSGARRR